MSPSSKASARPRLDRGQVVDAALAVADQEGLEAVTVRRVAQDLGVTPMALYWHFKEKESLLDALAVRVWDNTLAALAAQQELSAGADVWNQLAVLVEVLARTVGEHPPVANLVPLQAFKCEAGLALSDHALELLERLGLTQERAAFAAVFILNSVVGMAVSAPGAEVPGGEDKEEAMRQKHLALLALPPGKYPHVLAAAPYFTDCELPGEYFKAGTELLLGGLRELVEAGD